jgi:hypothetical protein
VNSLLDKLAGRDRRSGRIDNSWFFRRVKGLKGIKELKGLKVVDEVGLWFFAIFDFF